MPPKTTTSPDRLRAAERRARAWELRVKGWAPRDIARELGITRQTVWTYVRSELAKTEARTIEAVDEYRQVQLARCEEATRALWQRVEEGDLGAHKEARNWQELAARLAGTMTHADVDVSIGQVIIARPDDPFDARAQVVDQEPVELPALEPGDDEAVSAD